MQKMSVDIKFVSVDEKMEKDFFFYNNTYLKTD